MDNQVKNFFDAKASNWDNLEIKTHKCLNDFIINNVPLKQGLKVLDLGCGTGIISEIIYQQTKTKVKAMDVSPNMISLAKQKHHPNHIEFLVDDFYHTTESNMDMILCFNAYPHFVDTLGFVKKAKEVLKDDGILVIIHNLSRDELDKCHQGISSNISRALHSVEEEASLYRESFDLIDLVDDDKMFKLILKKKS